MAAYLLNKSICQAACIIAIFAACSATATTIAGFINMGSFHATNIESTVGIWVGLLLFVSVFMGLIMMGTRHMKAGVVYLIVNIISLGFSIYGVIIAIDYWQEFKEFREYNDEQRCAVSTLAGIAQCLCTAGTGGGIKLFKEGFSIEKCPMYSLGEDLWLAVIVLISTCILWSLIGAVLGLGAWFTERGTEKGAALRGGGSFR